MRSRLTSALANNLLLILLNVLLLRGPEVTHEVELYVAPVIHEQPITKEH